MRNMQKLSQHFSLSNSVWFAISIVSIALLLLVLLSPAIADESRSGWVQAVGSIGAIIGAIWVMNTQHQQVELREARSRLEREVRFLSSIRIELEVLLDGFQKTTGISSVPVPEALIEQYYIPPSAPFTIYDSLAANIVDVQDDLKRRLIIEVYSKAKSVLVILQMNNEHLRKWEEANSLPPEECAARLTRIERDLRSSAHQFWNRYSETVAQIETIKNTFPN